MIEMDDLKKAPAPAAEPAPPRNATSSRLTMDLFDENAPSGAKIRVVGCGEAEAMRSTA